MTTPAFSGENNQTPPCPLVRLDNVSITLGETTVFSNLSLSIHAGEHLSLIGPNGAGKSTLLRLIQAELRPTQNLPGHVYWGFDGHEDTSALCAREHVRLVSPAMQRNYTRQEWKITGEEVILSGLDNAAMIYGELSTHHYQEAAQLAEAANASHLLGMLVPTMSQGQLRLILLLRALISNPPLLLLDEPFDGLDTTAREAIAHCIDLAIQRGTTLLTTAHREEDIPACVTEVLIANNGQFTRQSRLSLLTANIPEVQDAFSLNASSCPLSVTAFATPSSPTAPCGTPIMQLVGVDVFIDRKQILFDINWTVKTGEQWVISGVNGSGKSTLLRLLHGEELAAWGGTFLWYGNPRPCLEELHTQIAVVSDRLQDTYSYDITAKDVVLSGIRGTVGLYHQPTVEELATAGKWMELLEVSGVAHKQFLSLSSGTARRILLARALAGAPPVLLLDEPCSGLDPKSRALFLHALPLLAANGVTLIHVSHHEQDKTDLFTHELVLKNGRILRCGAR